MITSQVGVDSTYYTSSTTENDINIESLGKNDFMELLLAQMKNQDPLNPTDNTEFVAQLAQFSSLEQMTNMNKNLESMLQSNEAISNSVSNSALMNYFGKEVTAESNSFYYNGSDSVDLTFDLDGNVATGAIAIKNADGSTVAAIKIDGLDSGENAVTWDGVTVLGTSARSGTYTYEFAAYDVLGNEVTGTANFSGKVDGIIFKEGEAQLKIGGVLIPVDSVKQITESD